MSRSSMPSDPAPARRIGRMPGWQRWTTWLVMGVCLSSGLGYFVAQDVAGVGPSGLNAWWIAHGVSSLVALCAIGAATAQHVGATWRSRRGRASGALNLAALLLLSVTALMLFYGPAAWRDPARLVHWTVGIAAAVVFPVHVLWGRTRRARLARADETA